jgi:hypothetical protein
MRILWDVMQDLVKAPTEVATSKESELRLRAAMIEATTAINPSWKPPQTEEPKGMEASRHSRLDVYR